uniref:Ribosomal protein S1 n=1 Tax=Zygnema circumcarinatum TaxID=35869 RepID=A0A6N0GXH9_ZYGCR|nr:ribosomal protein S1 [Zygnema circumcarinatum]QKQ14685.1 ribosomal protein S1 [Zygnema circumcarinatum]WEL36330.1 ribosomal protein S1 [Zygnema circumcarinatum]
MSFVQLFQQSNTSCNHLRGNVIQCSIEHKRGNMVFLKTGLKNATVCFKSEIETQNASMLCVGIESVEFLGEPKVVLPKILHKISRRKLTWTSLTKVWRNSQNRIRGFILNSVNGGYAVAIAGHIAFLPRSLRIDKKIFHSQWRMFSILNMNPKIRNIVVKELVNKTNRARTFSEIRFGERIQKFKSKSMINTHKKQIKSMYR